MPDDSAREKLIARLRKAKAQPREDDDEPVSRPLSRAERAIINISSRFWSEFDDTPERKERLPIEAAVSRNRSREDDQ